MVNCSCVAKRIALIILKGSSEYVISGSNGVSYKQIPRDTDIAKLTDKQREHLTALTYQQMAYAGYRLAYILNDIFKE